MNERLAMLSPPISGARAQEETPQPREVIPTEELPSETAAVRTMRADLETRMGAAPRNCFTQD